MAQEIGTTDVKLHYASIDEAKQMSGLRLILGAYPIPGPWREACKEIFRIKKIPYIPVTAVGKDGSDRELVEWTAQQSAPVAIWNDERPRSTWIEQLYLAERLQPTPALSPANIEDRVLMFGYINEICENGLRGPAAHHDLRHGDESADRRSDSLVLARFGTKYGYNAQTAEAAPASGGDSTVLSARLEQQYAKATSSYRQSALCARCVLGYLCRARATTPELCPMATAFRSFYTERILSSAASPLLEHRRYLSSGVAGRVFKRPMPYDLLIRNGTIIDGGAVRCCCRHCY